MNRRLEQQRAGRRETPQKILQCPGLGEGGREDHRVLRPERRAIEGRADQQAKVGHPPQRHTGKLVGQPHAGAGRAFLRGGQFDSQLMEIALSHE